MKVFIDHLGVFAEWNGDECTVEVSNGGTHTISRQSPFGTEYFTVDGCDDPFNCFDSAVRWVLGNCGPEVPEPPKQEVRSTPATIDWRNPEQTARVLRGNWKRFESFCWHDQPDDAHQFCIVNTHHRDSGLLDQSNADAIRAILQPFLDEEKDVFPEHANHWAVGWVDGYSIRCVDETGAVTAAFRAYCEIRESLDNYPVLDEEDYSRREYEATLKHIEEAGFRFVKDDPPEDWASRCFSWFWDNDQEAVENTDDSGGYPSEAQMRECLAELDLLDPEYAEAEEVTE